MIKSSYSITDKIVLLLATGFYSGHAPKAPGTVGTIIAILPLLLLQKLPLSAYLSIVLTACIVGFYICDKADKLLKTHDNKAIVWDEFCGLWITFIAIPADWLTLFVGFVLFRFFDIVKPWPISLADRKVAGGVGVMLDDILAGILSLAVLHGLLFVHVLPLS